VGLVAFGTYPTPVQPLPSLSRPGCALWVKRDDVTSPLYGGNKVRKLERLLLDAKARGAERIVTVGAVGSHHVLATTVFARQVGLPVDAVLVPQPRTLHVVQDLRADLAQGLRALPASSYAHAALLIAGELLRRKRYFVPVGGSNLLGALGYVDAARELAEQVRAGQMPEPDLAVVTLGSGGTVGGIAAGLALCGMKTRILAVTVAEPAAFVARTARTLAVRCIRHEDRTLATRQALDRIEIDRRWLGPGYGFATPEGERATATAAGAGLTVDPTYTAKTFAAALDAVEQARGKTILYWHTLSSAPISLLLDGAPPAEDLPPALTRLLR
jgi:1-aminocyclopropane-1-carboxylate deaminase/D-cysteine desulfhydrase-like pyridoxal-dependent ACC family enzyme